MKEMSDQERMQKEFYSQRALQAQEQKGQLSLNEPFLRDQQQMGQSLLIQSLEPDKICQIIESQLRGQLLNSDGEVIRQGTPLMNQLGIDVMMAFTRSVVNQNIIVSHFEPKQIGVLMEGLSKDVVLSLSMNVNKFEIDPLSNIDLINDLVLLNCNAAFLRGSGGGERNLIRGVYSESAQSQDPFAKNKSGWGAFMDKFKL